VGGVDSNQQKVSGILKGGSKDEEKKKTIEDSKRLRRASIISIPMRDRPSKGDRGLSAWSHRSAKTGGTKWREETKK